MTANNEIRLSQLIQTFGPGALVDLPDKSVMIKGLGSWPLKSGNREMRRIEEPRLIRYLTLLLEKGTDGQSWLEDGVTLELYEPPLKDNSLGSFGRNAVPAVIYPRWQVVIDPDHPNRQKLERFTSGEKARTKKGVTKTPVRWIAACKKGHVDDINWRNFAHGGRTDCQQDMYLRDEGAGGDPQYIWIHCDCGQGRRRLSELYTASNPLGPCHGHRPWLDEYTPFNCGEPLFPMTRGAINNYYSQVLRLIALPQEGSALEKKIQEFLSNFDNVQSIEAVMSPIEFGDQKIKRAFKDANANEIWQALQAVRSQRTGSSDSKVENPKVAEYDILASGKKKIGADSLSGRLYAETLDDKDWRRDEIFDTRFVDALVSVHRLCEVSSLYGFTRIEPARSPFDDNLEDIALEVEGQSLDNKISWLPAMEQFGEGLFLKLNCELIGQRCRDPEADEALRALEDRYNDWFDQDPQNRRRFPGREYVVAHSLSHMLIEQIALEAGYPSTSLTERVYALAREDQSRIIKLGVLIYAAGGGSQGTLGGLVEQSANIPELLRRGAERLKICSNDPICSSQSEVLTNNDELINGAACHGCLFTAETSCEKRNMLLDRKSLLQVLS